MTEMFGEAWSPMSVPDLAPDDDIYIYIYIYILSKANNKVKVLNVRSIIEHNILFYLVIMIALHCVSRGEFSPQSSSGAL